MAEEDENENAIELDDSGKKAGKGKLILIVVLAIVLLSGITVGALYFTGALGSGDSKNAETDESATEAEVVLGPVTYFELKPEFVVNFEGEQKANFLQVDIQLMTRNSDVLNILNEHAPLIRNNILLLLSGQKYNELRTLDGKEKMRAEVLAGVQQIVEAELGIPGVEAVFFTSFIMQ